MSVSVRVCASRVALLSSALAAILAQEEGIAIPAGQRQLFVDACVIAEIHSLEHVLHGRPDTLVGPAARPRRPTKFVGPTFLSGQAPPRATPSCSRATDGRMR